MDNEKPRPQLYLVPEIKDPLEGIRYGMVTSVKIGSQFKVISDIHVEDDSAYLIKDGSIVGQVIFRDGE